MLWYYCHSACSNDNVFLHSHYPTVCAFTPLIAESLIIYQHQLKSNHQNRPTPSKCNMFLILCCWLWNLEAVTVGAKLFITHVHRLAMCTQVSHRQMNSHTTYNSRRWGNVVHILLCIYGASNTLLFFTRRKSTSTHPCSNSKLLLLFRSVSLLCFLFLSHWFELYSLICEYDNKSALQLLYVKWFLTEKHLMNVMNITISMEEWFHYMWLECHNNFPV